MKIYVASSWRNAHQPDVVALLREMGHTPYDFRQPHGDGTGFSWSQVDPHWQLWNAEGYLRGLEHPRAIDGFETDMEALASADACVMVMPCGRSAHLEAGYAIGANIPTAIYFPNAYQFEEAELMYRMADEILVGEAQLLKWAAAAYENRTKEIAS